MSTNDLNIYYVYVLFDWLGVPRYVGKGKGNRWLSHEKSSDPNNPLKNEFIELTWMILEEIPKIKVRENISEAEAFETEVTIIRAIGRTPNGPLVNLTDNRNGPSSERITQWHASRTPEERLVSIRKIAAKMTPEALSRRGSNNALAAGRDVLSERMKSWLQSLTAEQRSENGRAGGKASAANKTPEELIGLGKRMTEIYMNNSTPEERHERYKRSGIAKFTYEELSENGKKGVAVANANRTPEERKELGRRAAAARFAKMTPEERVALARLAGLAAAVVNATKTPEERSAAMKKRVANMSTERLRAIARKGIDSQTPEQLKERARKGVVTRQLRAALKLSQEETIHDPELT